MRSIRSIGNWHVPLLLGALMLSGFGLDVLGHEDRADPEHQHGAINLVRVAPEEEKQQAAEMLASGLGETTGIENVSLLGTVPPAGQIDSVDGYMLRARELDMAPGGDL